MKKALAMLLSLTLLLGVCAAAAFADPNPSQTGDQGGAKAAELDKLLRERNLGPQNSAPVSNTPSYSAPVGDTSSGTGYVPDGSTLIDVTGTYGGVAPGGVLPDGTLNGTGGVIYGDPAAATAGTTTATTPTAGSGGTQTLDWFAVGKDLISNNKSITIYDTKSGVTWGATYINGGNHADIIPASAGDAEVISKNGITGSYVRRPVVVTIAGTKYAGSMYAVGHGETSYCTYFKGVMCIHFTGSMTHGSKTVDKDHQAAIAEALKSN